MRFAGRRIGIFDYTFGGLYYHENDKGHFAVNQQFQTVFQDYKDRINAGAGFLRVTAHLTDKLRLTGGVRYTDDHKNFNGDSVRLLIVCRVIVAGVPTCPAAPFFPVVNTLAQEALPVPGVNGVLPVVGTGAIVSRGDVVVNSPLDNSRTTYRAAVEYDLGSRSLAYASFESGFRAGGFSLVNGYQTYQPEYIDAYTVGVKNLLFDNRLELNAELFYWKYRNQQISHLGVDLAGQTGNFTQNVGASTNQGVELEGRYLTTPDTTVTANVQYLDATYDHFLFQAPISGGAPPLTGCKLSSYAPNPTLDNVDCSGKQSFNAPKWTLDFGLQHTATLGPFRLQGLIDTQYQSGRYVGFDYIAPEHQTPTWQTNAQLILTPDTGPWSLAVFVRNLEDNRYATNANSFANLIALTTANPRTYGIRASVKY